jgi:hypothetical protein
MAVRANPSLRAGRGPESVGFGCMSTGGVKWTSGRPSASRRRCTRSHRCSGGSSSGCGRASRRCLSRGRSSPLQPLFVLYGIESESICTTWIHERTIQGVHESIQGAFSISPPPFFVCVLYIWKITNQKRHAGGRTRMEMTLPCSARRCVGSARTRPTRSTTGGRGGTASHEP